MRLSRVLWFQQIDVFLSRCRPLLRVSALLILAILAGCSSLNSVISPATDTPAPTGTKVVLPPTWTRPPPTSSPTPSRTPIPSLTSSPVSSPTITPTAREALLPTTTVEPTGISLQPSPTLDWGRLEDTDCTFTATEPGIRIYTAPFIDPYHVLPTMEPGKPYHAVLTNPTYTLLLEDSQPLGWVDYRITTLTSEGRDCLTEYDQREIWDYPLCFFTPLRSISGYTDSQFTTSLHTLAPPASFVLLYQAENYYFTAYGSSGPSFVVKKGEVYTHGNCENIPTLAKAVTKTSLYTDLPALGGKIVYTLDVDESIFIQGQQREGSPPPGGKESGYWVLARRHSWSEDINGWVWSGDIELK